MVDAIISGQVIEEYPDRNRVLVCGRTTLSPQVTIYLHVLCEYSDPVYIEIITAYIPDTSLMKGYGKALLSIEGKEGNEHE